MNLAFLAPLFALGALAVIVPIVIHMVHRQRTEGLPFPSLMFLQRIPHKAQRRQKIRHWLIFVLRSAALILLALAFARPLLSGDSVQAISLGGGREIVMLVDRSYSMGYGDHWDRAQQAVRDRIDALAPEDRATIIAFDRQAEAVSEPLGDPVLLRSALNQIAISDAGTSYAPALRLAQQIIGQSEASDREVVVVSDFQRTGQSLDDVVRLPDGVRLTPVNVSSDDPSANVGIASVTVSQTVARGRESAEIAVRLVGSGDISGLEGLSVSLELNGQVLQTRPVEFANNTIATPLFDSFLVPQGLGRGVVRIAGDRLATDNAFHFTLSSEQSIGVLLLHGGRTRDLQNFYFERALAVGDHPSFAVTTKRFANFQQSDLTDAKIVVLNDVAFPSGTAGDLLKEFVRTGGGLFITLGDGGATQWPSSAQELLPGTIGRQVDRIAGRGGSIAGLDFGHPVFEVFSSPRSGDFSSARVYRYRAVQAEQGDDVLARYDDGAPALLEKRFGDGRVLVWTTTLDTYWSDLPIQPSYLPFVHQTAQYLANYSEAPAWFNVGDVVDLPHYAAEVRGGATVVATLEAGDEVNVELPSGDRDRVRASDGLYQTRHVGFYTVTPVGDPAASPMVIAVNADPRESDMTPLDMQAFIASTGGNVTTAVLNAGALEAPSLEDLEKRQGLWWYVVLVVLLILALETFLSNRLSTVARTPAGGTP